MRLENETPCTETFNFLALAPVRECGKADGAPLGIFLLQEAMRGLCREAAVRAQVPGPGHSGLQAGHPCPALVASASGGSRRRRPLEEPCDSSPFSGKMFS